MLGISKKALIEKLKELLQKLIKKLKELRRKPEDEKRVHERKKPIEFPEPWEESPSIPISRLERLFERYKVNDFSKLREAIQNDGRKTALKKLTKALEEISSSDSYVSSAENFIKRYRELEVEDDKKAMTIENLFNQKREGISDFEGKKIYPEAIMNYIREYELKVDSQQSFEKAMIFVLKKIYNLGKKDVLGKFNINIEYLNEYIKMRDSEGIKSEFDKIQEKLENIKKDYTTNNSEQVF